MSVFSSGLASRFQASFDRVPHVVIGKAVPHVYFAFYVRCLTIKSRLVVLKDLHGSAASVRRLNARLAAFVIGREIAVLVASLLLNPLLPLQRRPSMIREPFSLMKSITQYQVPAEGAFWHTREAGDHHNLSTRGGRKERACYANKPNLPPFFLTTLPHHIHGVPKLFHTLLPIPIVQGTCIWGSTGYTRGFSRGELNGLDSRRKIRKTVVTRKFFVFEWSKKIMNQIHLEILHPPKLAFGKRVYIADLSMTSTLSEGIRSKFRCRVTRNGKMPSASMEADDDSIGIQTGIVFNEIDLAKSLQSIIGAVKHF
ncbi:uncharacterized protein CLUP02_01758 [Colletotrichum lupini]|uniref:Uncharacterized protein n=1 Tax=Colletotrichum lupini TaxID=145971 RepID=A0A9Q8SDB2_9PEZI|nr:uncharacterized protein CLUP02_01758 [Colletotrichum lupini]UQC75105.1 hypothetical protein CLUP02_01758 [Colletotrichum lupini]